MFDLLGKFAWPLWILSPSEELSKHSPLVYYELLSLRKKP